MQLDVDEQIDSYADAVIARAKIVPVHAAAAGTAAAKLVEQ